MAQASAFWWQLINQISNWSLPEFKTANHGKNPQTNIKKVSSPTLYSLFPTFFFKRFSEPGIILGFLTFIVAMLLWNWKLLLALVIGIGVMALVYSMQGWDWQLRWLEMRRFLNSPNRRLALAVGSGGIATVSTYMAVAIWVDSHSPWIAAGAIVQGVGTLLTLSLLVWQIVSLYGNREEDHIDQLLINLTEKDPLKRLIALRQLTKFITRKQVDSAVQQDVVKCLQLLLSREEEAVIQEAAFASLQALDRLQALPFSTAVPLCKAKSPKSKVPSPEFLTLDP